MRSAKGSFDTEGQESSTNYFASFFFCLVSVEVDGSGLEEEGG